MKSKLAELIGNFILWLVGLILRIFRTIIVVALVWWLAKLWSMFQEAFFGKR